MDLGVSAKRLQTENRVSLEIEGTSRVFHMISFFFKLRNEGHRLGIKATIYLNEFSLNIIADTTICNIV